MFIAVLPRRVLSQTDREMILLNRVNELIRNFFNRPGQRSPYQSRFRWTVDEGDPNKKKYSVVFRISEPPDVNYT